MAGNRVLVAEDDPRIRELIVINLEMEDFEVITAVDGQDALDQVVLGAPDVVTLDVMMPRIDGWTVAQRIKADPTTSHIKVLLITARAQAADMRRAADVADEFLAKPFDPADLIAAVRRLAAS